MPGRRPGPARRLASPRPPAALGGVSSNTTYIESAAGVAEGGRTGFASVVTGVLFLLAIFLSPIAGIDPGRRHGAGPGPRRLPDVHAGQGHPVADVEDGIPALLTMILMPLTYDITVGIGAGFISWVLIKVVKGKVGEVHPLMWVVAIAFLVFFLPGLDPTVLRRVAARSPTLARRPGRRPGRRSVPVPSAAMFERTALPAGPRVISARLPGARSVSIAAYVLAGSRLETAGQAGVAHFMEHLTFKGTARLPVDARDQRGDRGRRRLVQRRDRPRVDRLLGPRPAARGGPRDGRARRADRPARASTTPTSTSERTVIIEEIRSYLDDPSEYCQILFQTAMFGDGPLGREICGDEAGIRALPGRRDPRLLARRCTGRPTRSSRSPATSATTRRVGLAATAFGTGNGAVPGSRPAPALPAGPRVAARQARHHPGPARHRRARRSGATTPTAGRWPCSTPSSATG